MSGAVGEETDKDPVLSTMGVLVQEYCNTCTQCQGQPIQCAGANASYRDAATTMAHFPRGVYYFHVVYDACSRFVDIEVMDSTKGLELKHTLDKVWGHACLLSHVGI